MTQQHTRGPWTAAFSATRMKGRRKFSLEATGSKWLGDLLLTEFVSNAEQDANAHLIAAAPDLLAAAIYALNFMPEGQPETRQLRNAIGKATSPQAR